ncbi:MULTISPECIES: LLM class F420-dependent oxidoreductase [unclassified Streptomyces]|uniref:LLM class F420-dependent oxidoreductase n=1 Tax=unclassified Streptomyces TaxID=2593676 RepID=UPI002365E6D5|nr:MULTISPECIES: LLM class F420-dependent oxidoreductase [unclassified Streptomyces]MDF3149355.1 LLM class F420-dependent oxidoreductase [Streptomyces sp. T21Q-yed]WDF43467.1 LLM class F420-dependent oxidoreductase [Streptomyces sp. T12]
MRVGVHINRFDHPGGGPALGGELAAAGAAAEAAGVSWLSVMDHYFQMEFNDRAEDPMLEAYTTLGYLAAHTSTVRLGALVTGVTYRHPGLLAKIVTSLDVLSGGRAALGIGAAWYGREHEGLGVPFPPVAERFERLEETLRICLQMWDPQAEGPFEGEHYRLAETLCVPAPVSAPHPEIMIGGGGEKKTLRLVARYGDACNLFTTSPEEVGHKLDVLRGHCDTEGRDYDEIRKTVLYMGDAAAEGDLDAFTRDIAGYSKLGIDTVILGPRTGEPAAFIENFAAPAVQRLAGLD